MNYTRGKSPMWNLEQLRVVRKLVERGVKNTHIWTYPEMQAARPGTTRQGAQRVAMVIRRKLECQNQQS